MEIKSLAVKPHCWCTHCFVFFFWVVGDHHGLFFLVYYEWVLVIPRRWSSCGCFFFCSVCCYSHLFDFYSYILKSFCLGLWVRCQIIWYFWVRNFSRKISCCSWKIDAWFHEEWRDRILSRSISREHVVFLLLLLLLLLQKFTCTHIIDARATGRRKLHFV